MSTTYITNPLSSEPPAAVKPYEDEFDAGRDCSFCCFTYIFCCLPVILGMARS